LSEEDTLLTRKSLDHNLTAIDLNRVTTGIAVVALQTAEETSRIARVSVYLVLATTPFIITLQYFTSDSKLFSFDRNVRTFFVSIGILMPALLGLALMLYSFDIYKGKVFRKVYEGMGGKRKISPQILSGEQVIFHYTSVFHNDDEI
jgi:hypothetical protein